MISNISTDMKAASSFYKISIMNDSVLRAKSTTLSMITDPLLYVGSSHVNFEADVALKDLHNADPESAMIYVSSSDYSVVDTSFENVTSAKYMAL